MTSRLADPAWVSAQYSAAENFDARVRLYRHSRNSTSWLAWVFERLALERNEQVLDVGCGPANLWCEHAAALPAGLRLSLLDHSPGMLDQARQRLGTAGEAFAFRVGDAHALPFADAAFDVVIANHVLYHVADRAAALGEAARVLSATGRGFVGTNDWTHLIELRELASRFGLEGALLPPRRDPSYFDLETAARELEPHFGRLELRRREDVLEVTSASDVVDYLRSMSAAAPEREAALARIHDHAAEQIARLGALHVSTSVGLFELQR